jgi:hypothetical protein
MALRESLSVRDDFTPKLSLSSLLTSLVIRARSVVKRQKWEKEEIDFAGS